ncbi:MAG: hypothetical protein ACQEXB_01470 [Bacillota bacterium]
MFDEEEYIIYYDIFEFLRCFNSSYFGDRSYFSGRFGFKDSRNGLIKFLIGGYTDDNWGVLEVCGRDKEKVIEALKQLVEDLKSKQSFNGYGLLEAYMNGENSF